MGYTAGTGYIQLQNIETIEVGVLSIDGCEIENGASLSITDGDMISLSCGINQEVSEKAAISFNYMPTTAAEGAAIMALDGTNKDVIFVFISGAAITLISVPISVNKKVVAGQPTKYEVTVDMTKSNIDEILIYT